LTVSASASQSRKGPLWSTTVAWAVIPRIRDRSSRSKPFMTDKTVMSAMTPKDTPSIEVSEMNEMKWLRRLARV
jgi:hypothetical protein